MTDLPISSALARGYLFWAGSLWRSFQVRRAERAEHRKLTEALRDLNAAQLRDIGFVRGENTDAGSSKSTSQHPLDRATKIEMVC